MMLFLLVIQLILFITLLVLVGLHLSHPWYSFGTEIQILNVIIQVLAIVILSIKLF